MLSEVTHLQEILDTLNSQTIGPDELPESGEQILKDVKGAVEKETWTYQVFSVTFSQNVSRYITSKVSFVCVYTTVCELLGIIRKWCVFFSDASELAEFSGIAQVEYV